MKSKKLCYVLVGLSLLLPYKSADASLFDPEISSGTYSFFDNCSNNFEELLRKSRNIATPSQEILIDEGLQEHPLFWEYESGFTIYDLSRERGFVLLYRGSNISYLQLENKVAIKSSEFNSVNPFRPLLCRNFETFLKESNFGN